MIRTRVGYMGGSKERPTYHSLGDHTESIQIDFDPAKISFEELVRQFFTAHAAYRQPYSVQYRSAIFTSSAQQEAVARRVIAELEQKDGRNLYTAIEPAGTFWLAEDYHQKYYLKNDRVFSRELRRLFGNDEAALIHSTAVARLSGLVGGMAPPSLTAANISQLGLSPEAEKRALEMLSGSIRPPIMCK
ncbi:peptide-methionine (S)-S-oxide reductase [bacterium]|nr:peptide-methionine (S)-S-oxide reductase [bacterium]